MPVRNGGKYFAAALASVCGQTLKDIEVLVVDADSEDGTLDLVRRMAASDHRIRLIRSEKRSMGHQYNLGIRVAHGHYIAFCESDDEYVPDFLNRVYAIAEENGFPDVVKSDFSMFAGDENERLRLCYHVLDSRHRSLYGRAINLEVFPDLIFRDVNMWNGIYRRSFLRDKRVKLNETPSAAFQDADFIAQVLLNAKAIIYTEGESYLYRRDNPDASSFKDTSIFWAQELVYMLAYFEGHPAIHEYYQSLVVERLFGGYCASVVQFLLHHPTDAEALAEESRMIQKPLQRFSQKISLAMRFRLQRNNLLVMLLNDQQAFLRDRQQQAEYEKMQLRLFREILQKSQSVCIFGTGELGQSAYANLRLNGYRGDVTFCDGAKDKIGKKIFSTGVQSVEVVSQNRKCIFLLPSPAHEYEMQMSLLRQGVAISRMLAYPFINPYSAFEFIWFNFQKQ